MKKQKNLQLKLKNFYKGLEIESEVLPLIDRLFVDYRPNLEKFKDYYQKSLNYDAERALEINRAYFDIVTKQNSLYSDFVTTNNNTTKENITQNLNKKQEILLKKGKLEAETRLIVNNAQINAQTEINEAEKKLITLINETNQEKENAKKEYMKESDRLIKERDEELLFLIEDYQKSLIEQKEKQAQRQKTYETQMQIVRQQREMIVSHNSEEYREIKENHTAFSIYYNSKVDEASEIITLEQRRLNEELIKPFSLLKGEIDKLQKLIEDKNNNIEKQIEDRSNELQIPFQKLRKEYDEAMREVLKDQNEKINKLNSDYQSFEKEINNQIKILIKIYEIGNQNKLSKREYSKKIKEHNLQKRNKKIDIERLITEIKEENNEKFRNLTNDFVTKRQALELEFVNFEYEKITEKVEQVLKFEERIKLINLQIERLEEEKNHKIWLLNSAYNKEISYLESILSLGSHNQDLLIQNQVGENSLLLAGNLFHSELIKTHFLIENERSQVQMAINHLMYQHQVSEVTSRYQLLIQKEMVKRDTILKQYEYEILIEKESLKKQNTEAIYNYEQIKSRAEYELAHQKNENLREIQQNDHILNLKTIKIENLTNKQEASIQLQIARAKAERNFKMYKISVEKNDRHYLGLFDILFYYHQKFDAASKILSLSYDDPSFTMTTFYHLIDIISELTDSFKQEMNEIILEFETETTKFIDQRIDELTGFKFINRKQELLDRVAASESLIKTAINTILNEKQRLTNDLNTLDAAIHRDNIQVSSLYKGIQNLKSMPQSNQVDETLIRLELNLSILKDYIKSSEKNKRQLENQIANKDRKIIPLERKLARSNRAYQIEKHRLTIQMERDAKIYYHQRNRNTKEFSKTKQNLKTYCKNLIEGLYNLKINLAKNINAFNDYKSQSMKYRTNFIEKMHDRFYNFRKINLYIYRNQVKDQQNIVDGFNQSYLRLNRSLNDSYENSFASEKRQNVNRNKTFDDIRNKLHSKFFFENDKMNQSNRLKLKTINEKMVEYDKLFTNTFVSRQQQLETIDINYDELSIDLDNQTTKSIEQKQNEFNMFYARKKAIQKDVSLNQQQLSNSTIARSHKYLENYLDVKAKIEESLKQVYEANLEQVKNRQQQFKQYLNRHKVDEAAIKLKYRQKTRQELKIIKDDYKANIRQIELNKY